MEIYAKVFSFVEKNCDSKIPEPKDFNDIDKELINNLKSNIPRLKEMIDNQNLTHM